MTTERKIVGVQNKIGYALQPIRKHLALALASSNTLQLCFRRKRRAKNKRRGTVVEKRARGPCFAQASMLCCEGSRRPNTTAIVPCRAFQSSTPQEHCKPILPPSSPGTKTTENRTKTSVEFNGPSRLDFARCFGMSSHRVHKWRWT